MNAVVTSSTHDPVLGTVSWSPDYRSGPPLPEVVTQGSALPPDTKLIPEAELHQLYDALIALRRDLTEHVRLAEYNLTGKLGCGDQVPVPNPPQLVHRNGITESERVLEQGRKAAVALNERLRPNWRNEQ